METAVVGLIGVAVGAFAGLAGTWLSLRHENKRWKQNKRDETYQLLGEWISEEWEWARDIGSNGIGPEDATSAPHERHRQVEVMVTIHGSKAIDRLLSKRSRAYVAFHNAATALVGTMHLLQRDRWTSLARRTRREWGWVW